MISRNTIDQIRELSIVDVIGRYVGDLKKAGSSYRAKSPFTDEKTPSFYVVPQKQIFKDFSTGKGGDCITFVMEFKNLNYPLAVKEICSDFNITVEDDYEAPVRDPQETERIEMLYKINQATARKYAQFLYTMDGSHPQFNHVADEIIRRQFTEETVIQWQIGYAPDMWHYLTDLLVNKGNYQHGFDLGLIKTKGERNYDTYRHRLIFPIQDERGRIVSFGGRHLNGAIATQTDGDVIKYINGPESPVYNKSKTLYGLFHAMPGIRKAGYAHVTEGYTDVISMHQAGFNNTIGTCGTSLTDDQVTLLKRYTQKVVLVFDGDKAGIAATGRAIDMFLAQGFEVDVLPLPEGKDPDDFVRMF
ncbi:MAG: DNA primase [Bacteroidota bacterium]